MLQGKAFVSDQEEDYFKTNSSKASTTISLKTQELSGGSEYEANSTIQNTLGLIGNCEGGQRLGGGKG